jgi:outer membrane protein assembly factor BamB
MAPINIQRTASWWQGKRPGRIYLWLSAGCIMILGGVAIYLFLDRERFLGNSQLMQRLANAELRAQFFEPAQDGDWPQWRGPNRDGLSRETGLLAAWPQTGPREVWQQPANAGYSNLAIANGKAITLLQDGEDEAVVCWNAATGQELWRYKYSCHYMDPQGSGPRSTPSIEGDRVYTVGAKGMFHCLKLENGDVIWKHDLVQEFHGLVPRWGVSFSPLVEGELVFANPGGPGGNSVIAFNKKTGDLAWKNLDDPPAYSSAVGATLCGKRQIIFFTQTGLVSVTPQDGSLLWRFPWLTRFDANIATPIVVGDYVFISSNYDRGCAVLEVTLGKDGAFQAKSVFEHNRMRNHFSTCVFYQDHLYGFDNDTLECMSFRTGEIAWKKKDFKKGSMLIADGKLIILGESGTLALAEASPLDYRQISSFQFSRNKCWTAPVLTGGRLYVRDEQKIVCYDLRGGS